MSTLQVSPLQVKTFMIKFKQACGSPSSSAGVEQPLSHTYLGVPGTLSSRLKVSAPFFMPLSKDYLADWSFPNETLPVVSRDGLGLYLHNKMKPRIFSRSASIAESEQHHAVMEGHLHTFPAHCSITDITFYYAFPYKNDKMGSRPVFQG